MPAPGIPCQPLCILDSSLLPFHLLFLPKPFSSYPSSYHSSFSYQRTTPKFLLFYYAEQSSLLVTSFLCRLNFLCKALPALTKSLIKQLSRKVQMNSACLVIYDIKRPLFHNAHRFSGSGQDSLGARMTLPSSMTSGTQLGRLSSSDDLKD
jgi:hypothetical protein